MKYLGVILIIFIGHFSQAQEPFKNGLTFKLAIVNPEANYGKFTNELGQADSVGNIWYPHIKTHRGFGIQFGGMFFLTSLNSNETMKLGLDVTWFGLNYLQQESSIILHHITGFFELGPSFSYSPAESMAIDVSFKLSPTIGVIGGGDTKNYRPLEGEQWRMGSGMTLRYTPALYFRYKILLIGAEYSIGDMNFNYNVQSNIGGVYVSEYESGTSPYSTLRLVLGFKF